MGNLPSRWRITPEGLPAVLRRVELEKRTVFALAGRSLHLESWTPESFPKELRGDVVYELTGELSDLPQELLQLRELQHLYLWALGLESKDAVALSENLDQLRSLDLSVNRIGDLGARAISKHLSRLSSLRLWGNGLSDSGVKAIAEHLSDLNSLDLGRNDVGDSGALAIAGSSSPLTSLFLAGSGIGDSGTGAIGAKLKGLQELDLSSNRRVTEVGSLAQLQLSKLDIRKTEVSDLSPLKSMILSGLDVRAIGGPLSRVGPGIYVKDCPLLRPSTELAQRGPGAVLNYFREIESQGVDQLFEAKLLIVGEGGAGKTSLMRRMFLPELDLPAEDETTRGINIHRHDFPISDKRFFRLNTWDFGGQQIYHATHQFFLTKRSLYVLVDDTRSDQRSIHDERLKFWLEVVETLSEGSPLLIFQNERGGRSKQLDEAGIKGHFPNLQDILRGNLEHPDAAAELRRSVEFFAQKLPHIGEDVPAKWVAIRKDLEQLAKARPYIQLEEYFEVYERNLEMDEAKALRLSQFLHDLGVFLHFQRSPELRRTVFLKNEWITEAVFRVLDDEKVKSQRGRFTLEDCDRLWAKSDSGGKGASELNLLHTSFLEKDVELRALMERFELCYRLPDQAAETWLVPQHLPPSKPVELRDWADSGDLVLKYKYEFLPRGLASRLMVRMHRFVKCPDLSWSHGALFEHGESRVLVEITRSDEITLRSRGPERKALLSVIASDLDALNASFEGLKHKVGKKVPCVCDTCAGLKEPQLFPMRELVDRRRRGKATIECSKPPHYYDVSVFELLDGMRLDVGLEQVGMDLWPGQESPRSTDSDHAKPVAAMPLTDVKTIRIFLASSAELRGDRDEFELYFLRQNERLRKEGFHLKIIRWEDSLDAVSSTRSQDEYNLEIKRCDVFVSLFKTKTGRYTEEEFDVAHSEFQRSGRPLMYTYFRDAQVSTDASSQEDLMSLWAFQEKLDELGHFWTKYDSTSDLQKQFRDQLDKLRDKTY